MALKLKSKTGAAATKTAGTTRSRGTKATTKTTTPRTRGTSTKTTAAKKTTKAATKPAATSNGNSGVRTPVPEGMTARDLQKLITQMKRQREKQDKQAATLKEIQAESHALVLQALQDGVSMAIIHREFGYSRQFMYKLMGQNGVATGGTRKKTTRKPAAKKPAAKKAPARKPVAKKAPARKPAAKRAPARGGLKLKSR